MFEDDIEDGELESEETDDLELDEVDDDFSVPDDGTLDVDQSGVAEDEGEAPVRSSKVKAKTVEEELPSVEAKRKERDALAEAMAAFLARGGKIQSVETGGE